MKLLRIAKQLMQQKFCAWRESTQSLLLCETRQIFFFAKSNRFRCQAFKFKSQKPGLNQTDLVK